jgi:hypothetical protein
MRSPATIALISAIIAAGSGADAQEMVDPELEPLTNAHATLAIETSGGDGGGGIGFRIAGSYDLLHGNGDTVRPALGVGVLFGGTGRDAEGSSKGIYDLGGMVTASLRFHTDGVIVDKRLFATAALLSDFGPMTTQGGSRISVGGNWFSAAAEAHNAWLLMLPNQLEAFYQHQLGDHRYGLALAYGF